MQQLEHEDIIYTILKKYGLNKSNDDYLDVAYIGYIKALNNHDEKVGTLRTYIYKCVENEILNELRHESRGKRKGEFVYQDDCFIERIQATTNIECEMIQTEQLDGLYEALQHLGEMEQLVISHLYKLNESNMTLAELSECLNKSEAQVRTIKKNALKQLQLEMGATNEF